MVVHFAKNKNSGAFDVCGLSTEVKTGPVTVTRKDGTTVQVAVVSVGKKFTGKFGENEGKECVFGIVGNDAVENPVDEPKVNPAEDIPF